MKFFIFTFFLFNSFITYSQANELSGNYRSVNNKFERWSNMTLNDDGTFFYSYGVGGCQMEITGTYIVSANRIKFTNDFEYTEEYWLQQDQTLKLDSLTIDVGTPYYPDLSNIEWKLGKNFIKPLEPIDGGCITESGKHKRK